MSYFGGSDLSRRRSSHDVMTLGHCEGYLGHCEGYWMRSGTLGVRLTYPAMKVLRYQSQCPNVLKSCREQMAWTKKSVSEFGSNVKWSMAFELKSG